jgi:chloramphenicol-sensitive protein RarD
LVRKRLIVSAVVGLSVETLLLAPAALAFLLWRASTGAPSLGVGGLGRDGLLLLSGPVTAVPLLLFAQAARRLPLSLLGFLQYLAPTVQLLLAVTLLDEPFLPCLRVCFGFIWAALALAALGSLRPARRPTAQELPAEEGIPERTPVPQTAILPAGDRP